MVEHIVKIIFNGIESDNAPDFRHELYQLLSKHGYDTELTQHTIMDGNELIYYSNIRSD